MTDDDFDAALTAVFAEGLNEAIEEIAVAVESYTMLDTNEAARIVRSFKRKPEEIEVVGYERRRS